MEDKETLIREIEEDTNRVLDSWRTSITKTRGLLKSAVLSPVRRNQLARRFVGLTNLQYWVWVGIMLAFLAFVFTGVLLLYGGFTTLDARDHITPGTSRGAALALLGAIFIFVGSGLCWWLLFASAASDEEIGMIKGEILALQPKSEKKPGKKAKAATEEKAEQSELVVLKPNGEPDKPVD